MTLPNYQPRPRRSIVNSDLFAGHAVKTLLRATGNLANVAVLSLHDLVGSTLCVGLSSVVRPTHESIISIATHYFRASREMRAEPDKVLQDHPLFRDCCRIESGPHSGGFLFAFNGAAGNIRVVAHAGEDIIEVFGEGSLAGFRVFSVGGTKWVTSFDMSKKSGLWARGLNSRFLRKHAGVNGTVG